MKKVKKRKRGRRIVFTVLTVLILAVAAAGAYFFFLYRGKEGQLDELKKSEIAKQQAYEEVIKSASLPAGWSQETLTSLQNAALAAYDSSLLDQIEKAENGDEEAAKSLENVTESTLSKTASEYEKLFSNLNKYPEAIAKIAVNNPGNLEFVLAYNGSSDGTGSQAEVLKVENLDQIPNLKTADPSWGYMDYNNDLFVNTGSAPTALAMVLAHVLKDKAITPVVIADYAKTYGYDAQPVKENDTLFGAAAYSFQANMTPVPAYKTQIDMALQNGTVVIVQVGDENHSKFIVVDSINDDGTWNVLDPTKSGGMEKVNPDDIKEQIMSAYSYW